MSEAAGSAADLRVPFQFAVVCCGCGAQNVVPGNTLAIIYKPLGSVEVPSLHNLSHGTSGILISTQGYRLEGLRLIR